MQYNKEPFKPSPSSLGYNARMNTSIKTFSNKDLEQLLKDAKQPKFRLKQLKEWLYVHQARSYDEMTNLPAAFRTFLKETAPLTSPETVERRISTDGTRKYILGFHDGAQTETVGIPAQATHDRLTVCFSTQVGCAMQCGFCATGYEGFTRNLGAGEIVDQVLSVQNDFGIRVTNLVAMGQGEPFLNYENTLDALRILNDSKGIAIGARKITVSTCGILPGIERFSKEPEQFTLAISLHSARQEVRDILMPRVAQYPLSELKNALVDYIERTNRRVTLEYLMINGVNDRENDLKALEEFSRGLLCHINLLPMNAVSGSPYQPSARQTVEKWIAYLNSHHIETTLRTSRGVDIEGACGQLKHALKK